MKTKTLEFKLVLKDSGIGADPVNAVLVCTDPSGIKYSEKIDTVSETQAAVHVMRSMIEKMEMVLDLYQEQEVKPESKPKSKPRGGK